MGFVRKCHHNSDFVNFVTVSNEIKNLSSHDKSCVTFNRNQPQVAHKTSIASLSVSPFCIIFHEQTKQWQQICSIEIGILAMKTNRGMKEEI